jgi:hypothetical protein
MKRKREINGEQEEGYPNRKQQNRRVYTRLDDLPDNILGAIIRHIGLLEKHMLRFVCKKTHRIILAFGKVSPRKARTVHEISLSLSINFHHPNGFDTLAAKGGSVKIFNWIIVIINYQELSLIMLYFPFFLLIILI